MKFIRMDSNYKTEIGAYIDFHYGGLDTSKIIGNFFVQENGGEVVYLRYDDETLETAPEGGIFITEEEFMMKNEEYRTATITDHKTTLEQIGDLKKANASLEEANLQTNMDLGNLLIQNAMDKATIAELNDTIGGLLFEVATLKGGAA